jgi:hypothetical protein
MREELTKKISE